MLLLDRTHVSELDAALLDTARFVCDDRALTVEMGAIGNAGLDANSIDATLGEVLRGDRPGRSGPDEVSIFASVGLAFQDLVAGWQVYQEATRQHAGTEFDFLA